MDATPYNNNIPLERVWNEKLSVVVILALSFFASFCRTRLIMWHGFKCPIADYGKIICQI